MAKTCRRDVFKRGYTIFVKRPMAATDAERKTMRLRKQYPKYYVDWHYDINQDRVVIKKLLKPWWRRIFCGTPTFE